MTGAAGGVTGAAGRVTGAAGRVTGAAGRVTGAWRGRRGKRRSADSGDLGDREGRDGRSDRGGPAPPGTDLTSQVLLTAIVLTVGAFAVSQRVYAVSSAREIAPVLPFAAALAARQFGPVLARPVPRNTGLVSTGLASTGLASTGLLRAALARLLRLLLVAAGARYLAGFAAELTVSAAPPQAAPLTAWFERHPLGGAGLAGYWQANVVTLASGGTVAVRPVDDTAAGVVRHDGETKDAWFDPRRSTARFFVFAPRDGEYPGFTDERAVRATWGAPARVYHAGVYTIWWWPANLLGAIRPR